MCHVVEPSVVALLLVHELLRVGVDLAVIKVEIAWKEEQSKWKKSDIFFSNGSFFLSLTLFWHQGLNFRQNELRHQNGQQQKKANWFVAQNWPSFSQIWPQCGQNWPHFGSDYLHFKSINIIDADGSFSPRGFNSSALKNFWKISEKKTEEVFIYLEWLFLFSSAL